MPLGRCVEILDTSENIWTSPKATVPGPIQVLLKQLMETSGSKKRAAVKKCSPYHQENLTYSLCLASQRVWPIQTQTTRLRMHYRCVARLP